MMENPVPVVVSPVIFNVEAPVFVRATVLGCAVFWSLVREKLKLAGMSLTVPKLIVMAAVADLLVSVTDVAVIVTLAFAGTAAGAA